jgi:hypothetical protein
MFTCALAGVNGAVTTVAVDKNAAAARDVIAIRFNMTCLLLRDPTDGQRAGERYYAADPWGVSGQTGGILALIRPLFGHGQVPPRELVC